MARTRQPLEMAFFQFVMNCSDAALIGHGIPAPVSDWRSEAINRSASWPLADAPALDAAIGDWLQTEFSAASIRVLRQRYSAWKHRQSKQLTSISVKASLKQRLLEEAERQGLDSIDGVIEFLLDDK